MNDRIEQLMNESTVECMGVNQLNPRLFAEAIIRECAKVADSYDHFNWCGNKIKEHFGVTDDTTQSS